MKRWNISVAVAGIIGVSAIVIVGMLTGHNNTLAASGLAIIGGAVGYAVKNRAK